ncbi:uncharacterized protein N7498_011014 [Penicillium cinerascens]|uniref:Mid2 domain-containing protein n=1 Tax=Penicillium cinerascens TaxID=70096 RepID=A0A9W9J7M4_9EURO|nr:uncharacterized protein N7498_011014 [Penicillium cinerascens]KAJ5192029.1 hypothetical protein N7498_011014 [Penicillium cinerascens]
MIPTTIPTTTPTTNQTSHTSESSGLSIGAKAGIGVGVGVGALLAISAFAALFLRERKNKKLKGNSQYTFAATSDTLAREVPHRMPQSELECNTIREASAGGQELKQDVHHNARHELPGESTGARGI